MKQAIILFTRVPIPGQTKTRLQSFLTKMQCSQLHSCFLKDVYKTCIDTGMDVFVFFTPGYGKAILQGLLGQETLFFQQKGEDLGMRMHHAIEEVLNLGYESCLLLGSDLPLLKGSYLLDAAKKLERSDLVICPSYDGGYYLIGMKRRELGVFENQSYGHGTVFENTLKQAKSLGLSVGIGEKCVDIDEKEDLLFLAETLEKNGSHYDCHHTKGFLLKLEPLLGEKKHG